MATKTTAERVRSDVVRWRTEQLLSSGVSQPLATHIGPDPRYDLHALIELVERGCAPELAVRILAPLEPAGDAA